MLTKRIVPCLDVDHGRVVKGVKFQGLQDVDDPVELAKHYSDIGADELVFYDITASNEEREIFLDVVEKTAYNVYIPFTVGGGIRTIDDFNKVLRAGADKVSVNSAAVKNPQLITEAALKFGSQCVVLSIDAKRRRGFLGGLCQRRKNSYRHRRSGVGCPRRKGGSRRAGSQFYRRRRSKDGI